MSGLCLALAGPVTILFFMVGGHQIVNNYHADWKRLNSLVATQETSSVRITLVSLRMIFDALYLSLTQYMNNSMRKISKNLYEVSYVINGKPYKMLVCPIRGRSPVVRITDENNEDITNEVRPYMGPNLDWHHTVYRPEFFSRSSLTFELTDGTIHKHEDILPHFHAR